MSDWTENIEGFTKKYKVHRLVYYETFDHAPKAIGREKQLKGWRAFRCFAHGFALRKCALYATDGKSKPSRQDAERINYSAFAHRFVQQFRQWQRGRVDGRSSITESRRERLNFAAFLSSDWLTPIIVTTSCHSVILSVSLTYRRNSPGPRDQRL
jgi:hypothetical protein